MPAKILVVDDEPFILKMVVCRLSANGYNVITAGNGKEALLKVKSELPSLILIDIMMPPPDGMEVTRILKDDIMYAHIPIILLTAKSAGAEISQAMECGADDYIIKPYNAADLLIKINTFLAVN